MTVFAKSIASRRSHSILMRGGLNLDSSALESKDGQCRQLINYECNPDGYYQSMSGYERFDGQSKPSLAEPSQSYDDEDEELEDLVTQRELRRSSIGSVPGSGAVLGVFTFDDVVYAFRNSTDGATAKMYRSTASGWDEVITGVTLAPSGKYRFCLMNIVSRGNEIVGVDGVNKAFIFNGTSFTQIDNVGMGEDDTPFECAFISSEILFLAYSGGSLQYSKLSDPTNFVEGGEIAIADSILELHTQPGDVLAILCNNRIEAMYGRTPLDWEKRLITQSAGIEPNTAQSATQTFFINDNAFTSINRVESFGDFEVKGLSSQVATLITEYRRRFVCSTFVRSKSQYRLFFDDGTGLVCTLGVNGVVGFSTFDYQGLLLNCIYSGETSDGTEQIFAGAQDGFVYQIDIGTSFDGGEITTTIVPQYSHCRTANQNKHFIESVMEVTAGTKIDITLTPYLDYLDPDLPESETEVFTAVGGGGVFDFSRFGESYWAAAEIFRGEVPILARGKNISLLIRSSSSTASPHLIKSVTYNFTIKGRK